MFFTTFAIKLVIVVNMDSISSKFLALSVFDWLLYLASVSGFFTLLPYAMQAIMKASGSGPLALAWCICKYFCLLCLALVAMLIVVKLLRKFNAWCNE